MRDTSYAGFEIGGGKSREAALIVSRRNLYSTWRQFLQVPLISSEL